MMNELIFNSLTIVEIIALGMILIGKLSVYMISIIYEQKEKENNMTKDEQEIKFLYDIIVNNYKGKISKEISLYFFVSMVLVYGIYMEIKNISKRA